MLPGRIRIIERSSDAHYHVGEGRQLYVPAIQVIGQRLHKFEILILRHKPISGKSCK
jgi:hypothetical protein